MINNFELIKPLFYFNEGNNMFFHCQIVQRSKDHPNEKVRESAIATYVIRSAAHLETLREEIITLCETHRARAYINVAGKDFYDVNRLMLHKLALYNYDGNMWEINPYKIVNRALGETKPRNSKWIVDVDDVTLKEGIYKWLKNLGWEDRQIVEIPTVQCCHFIVPKFNITDFRKEFPNVDVHKNSMGTLLYYPNSLDNDKERETSSDDVSR